MHTLFEQKNPSGQPQSKQQLSLFSPASHFPFPQVGLGTVVVVVEEEVEEVVVEVDVVVVDDVEGVTAC